jgi:3-hydroxyisobutyrate dehydrogenase
MTGIKKIGFIGIGNMGSHMARHLVGAGFDVTVMDTRPEIMDAFVAEHGCRSESSPVALGGAVDAVITMLPTSKIVRSVILGGDGADGVADGMAAGGLVIDMSTSSPTDTVALGEALKPKGISVMDAPVAGGVVFAKDGTLTIMTGGEDADKERARPLLEAMGKEVIDCSILGGAHTMKALNNYVNAAALITGIEAMGVALKFGLKPDVAFNALKSACTGRNNPIEKKIETHILTRKFATGMPVGLICKDVNIAVESADALGAFAPMAKETARLWEEARDRFGFDPDQSEVVRLWEAETGVAISND